MADRRVAGGHVIKTVGDLWFAAAGRIGHRAPREQPHHQLDALTARLPDILDVRDPRHDRRLVDQTVHEAVVPFPVDETRAWPLQLVTHTAGSPDLDIEWLVIARDGLSDGSSQPIAAPTGG